MRPTSPAVQPVQNTSNTYQWAPAPYSTLLQLLFQDAIAGMRYPSIALLDAACLKRSGNVTPFPFLWLAAAPESAAAQFLRVGEREPAANAYHWLPHHVLSRWLLLLNTSPAPLNPFSTPQGGEIPSLCAHCSAPHSRRPKVNFSPFGPTGFRWLPLTFLKSILARR